jgi:hypothetical protein
MFSINLKRPTMTLALIAGLAIAGPAGAGAAVAHAGELPSSQAHTPAPPEPSAGGHPSQGAATVGGGTKTEPEAYRSPTPDSPG